MLDVVIVGGGPAGLSTALHLATSAPAARIVVVEKARYPRDKICAGAIGARAFAVLGRIGVTVDCPRVRLEAIAIRARGTTTIIRQPGLGAVVRRIELDHALARIARARGIELREGRAVAAIDVSGRRCVRVTLDDGESLDARAVVGADGVGGIVRRAIGLPRGELRAQVVELDTEAAPGDLPRDTVGFDFDTPELRGYAWDFPTIVDGRPLVCRGAYVIRGVHARDHLARYLASRGLDLANYRVKQFAEHGWRPGAPIARPRVLLVGEAAGIDIATGEGIGQAIEYGALAGPYLGRALARDALDFAGWRRHVDRHHLGIQLRIRHACYRAFYGKHRPTLERLMPKIPSLLQLGAQDFAGVPLSPMTLMRGLAELAAAALA